MSPLFNRQGLVPVWGGVALGLLTLLGPRLPLATELFLLCMAIGPAAVLLILWRPSLTLAGSNAEVLPPAVRSRAPREDVCGSARLDRR